MSHFIATAIAKVSSADASSKDRQAAAEDDDDEDNINALHRPGVSPPLSPKNTRDEEGELSSPKALQPRPDSPEVQVQRAGFVPQQQSEPKASVTANDFGHPLTIQPLPRAQTQVHAEAGPSSIPMEDFDVPSLLRQDSVPGLVPLSRIPTAASYPPITPSSELGDPLLLRSRLVGETDLRRRTTGKGRKAQRNVTKFYDGQNEHIERLLKPMHQHTSDDEDERSANAFKIKFAIYGSFAANVILAALQLYAAASSLSLSLFATAADSVFDPFANYLLNWLHRKSDTADERRWPAGGSRFENVGNCVYAFVMASVSLILIVESIRDIASHSGSDKNQLHIPSLVAVGVAFGVKFALFLYCFSLRKFSSQIECLYIDHRNDLGINGLGIITSACGAKIVWWIDPAGAMLISCIIIVVWTTTAAENFRQLAGRGAPPEFLQLVTYNAMLFHERIQKIDSCKAYYSGPLITVEIDVVMDPETPLWQSHDVAQDLQDKLEALPQVGRCFVHVDHDTNHEPEHKVR